MQQIERFPAKAGDLGWFELSRYKDHKFTDIAELEKDYDYVIIGGGFAGINAAHKLAENRPNAIIALFEALKIGMGDSGRNAGFLMDIPHSFGEPGVTMDDHKYRFHLNKTIIERMRVIKNKHKLDVDWVESGKYLAGHETKYLKNLQALANIVAAIGSNSRFIEKDELAESLGTSYYQRALYTAGTVLINPSETVRGFATILPENVAVFEETPVLYIEEDKTITIQLVNGKRVKAGDLLILSGVFIDSFGIKQQGRMTPAGSFGAFTRELGEDELKAFQTVKPWGCTSAHAAGTTVRFTPTKRIFVRNGLTFPTHLTLSPERVFRARKMLRRAFENRFPDLKHVNFEYVYGGMIPLTINGASFFFQKSPHVYAAAVGDGSGLTRSSMLGTYLADLACGIDSEELQHLLKTSNPKWCPPEPIKTIAANIRMSFEELQAKGEI
ncbi:FAD-binding oxidoreductase [uncultured Bartonella sp.]|uniref:NAD(P)/FAD-dependent oxidoreductase n=1 Tax=uncultured Bartonella sp. TaxID=104108 RepID=UPI002625AFC8|nr:FAD-binding oxidoreductase [uncultured Bartonella sp.]